ncbi:MAG: outer membrane lipoprotein-sorting protein [Gammaproteobacteria bacterium]|nr:MAG: outer membrane lipoprotein-sorting protein [Gammaproteobacteria bacterium]
MNKWLLTLLLLIPLLPEALAETAQEKGLAIAVEMDQRDTGWGDMTADMQMILRNKRGDESLREIRVKSLEMANDGDKSLTIFDRPRDIKGTAFLSFTHALKPDDQWLYLPALKRVKRISSSNKSGPFMGSEFAYEDLSSQEVEKYTYKWLKNDTLDGRDVFVVERYPAYKHSGYKRMIVWIDMKIYKPLKLEFYDRKNALLKTLTFHDYKPYLEKYYRPDRMEMKNHQTGKSTTLTWADYQFGTGLSDRDFDRNALKRTR